jgi:uncharacterized protein YbjT (DUF2867 family)
MNPLEIVRTTRLDGLSREDRARAVDAFARLEDRLTKLEKVARLARVVVAMGDGPFNYLTDCQALENALTELDADR